MNAKQNGKISQSLMIVVLILITVLVSLAIWLSSKKTESEGRGYDEGNAEYSDEDSSEEGHAEEGEIQLTSQQMQTYTSYLPPVQFSTTHVTVILIM